MRSEIPGDASDGKTATDTATSTPLLDRDLMLSVLGSSNDCIKVLDLQARLVFMSEGGQRVMEVSDFNAIKGCPWPDFWEDAGNAAALAAVETARAGGIGRFQGWAHTMAGNARWWDVQVTPILGADGKPERLLSISRDISELKATETRLQQALALNASILQSSRDCTVLLDLDGRTQYVSPGGIQAMEITDLGSVIGQPWLRVWTGTDAEAARRAIDDARGGGAGRFQGVCATHRGTIKWWDVVITPLWEEGQVRQLVCVGRDITQRVRAQQRAAVVAERQGILLKQMPGFVAVVNGPEHVYEYVNDNFIHITRVRDVIGRSVRDVFPESAAHGFVAILDQVYATDKSFKTGAMPLRLVGEERDRYLDLLCQPIHDETGAVEGVFIAGYDVSERLRAEAELREIQATLEQRVAERTTHLRQAEEALRQAQKMEAVGQLTGGVAHDFNNLLTVIKSSSDLLKRPDLAEDRRARYVNAISDTVARAAKLTGQLLAFARRQALQPEVFDAVKSVKTIGEMMGTLTGSRIRIVLQMPDHACHLHADPNQFDTSLVNLVVNARDAMNSEGQLTVRVEAVDGVPAVGSQSAIAGPFVAVSITDTGSGIEPGHLDKIFEPFFTTKLVGQGTGLGLSQVFGFTQQSGGGVSVQSQMGQGTTFTLFLPRVDQEEADEGHSEAMPLMDGHGTCVLVVEDNAEVGNFATQTLEELGYASVWAINADEALSELARNADGFDVVFSDVIMPGMNGIELGQEIRRRYHDLPVVLTSGYSHVLAQNGTYGFELLHKPYSVEDLSHVLRKAARWKSRRAALRG